MAGIEENALVVEFSQPEPAKFFLEILA